MLEPRLIRKLFSFISQYISAGLKKQYSGDSSVEGLILKIGFRKKRLRLLILTSSSGLSQIKVSTVRVGSGASSKYVKVSLDKVPFQRVSAPCAVRINNVKSQDIKESVEQEQRRVLIFVWKLGSMQPTASDWTSGTSQYIMSF